MIVAVSLSVRMEHELQDIVNHSYITFLGELGCTPLLVPNALAAPSGYATSFGAEALVLTGGRDVTRSVDGGNADHVSVRHMAETELLAWAIDRMIPVVGICRGFHLLNTYFGGEISVGGGKSEHVRTVHSVRIEDVNMRDMFGSEHVEVNSFHNNVVRSEGLASVLRPLVYSPASDCIEGFRHSTLPIYGIQWHPERPGPCADANARMIQWFLGLRA